MKKRLIAFILIVTMLSAVFLPTASAADGAVVIVNSATATAGGYAYVYLDAKNFTDVATLDLQIFYDSNAMSVNYTSNGTLLSDASVSTNTSLPGLVKISALTTAGMNAGTSASRMMTICFKVDADCPAGSYPIRITVGDAYNNALSPVSIAGQGGTITVNAAAAKGFTLYGTQSVSTIKEDEVFSLQVNHSTGDTFAAADFCVEYDRELFALQTVSLHDNLKVEGAQYSINTNIEGMVRISYASTKSISSYYLFTVELVAIADIDTTTTVTVEASDVYTSELSAYAPYTLSKTVTFQKKEAQVDYPDLYLQTETLYVGQTASSTLFLEKGADVAAADFVVTYDPTVFECVSVAMVDGISDVGGLIMINPKYQEGEIRFSYINENGYDDTELALIEITWKPLKSEHIAITLDGSDVFNAKYQSVSLDYVSSNDCIYDAIVTPATCTTTGNKTYQCACGEVDKIITLPIDPDAHKVLIEGKTLVDSITTENDSAFPFLLEDGVYSSTNKTDTTDSFFTITALYDCVLDISYSVSSEAKYDKLIIRQNETTIAEISGVIDWATKSISLTAGDIVTINYHKDVSQSKNEDTGWFSFTCEQTEIKEFYYQDASEVEPTCTEGVTCAVCENLVKEPLGHDEISQAEVLPTCIKPGRNTVTCLRCDYTKSEEVAIDPTAHKWETEYTVDVPETCGVAGSKSIHCEYCDAVKENSAVEIPANGKHTPADEIIIVIPAGTATDGVGKKLCSVCGQDAVTNIVIPKTGAAAIGDTLYDTLAEALIAAKAGDTVRLTTDITEAYVTVAPKITLDLAGFTLEAEYAVGFAGAAIIDSSKVNSGRLVTAQDGLALSGSNGGYLPVYDGDAYIFSTLKLAKRSVLNGQKLIFSPVFEAFVHEALMAGKVNSNVRIVVRVCWTEETQYEAEQDFTYLDFRVQNVIGSYVEANANYARAFSATFAGTEAGNATNVTVTPVIISATGVEIAGDTSVFSN